MAVGMPHVNHIRPYDNNSTRDEVLIETLLDYELRMQGEWDALIPRDADVVTSRVNDVSTSPER